jgi:hypothetical protein
MTALQLIYSKTLVCLIFTVIDTVTFAQKNEITIRKNGLRAGFHTFLTEKERINRAYQNRLNADFESQPTVSFEGRLEYSRLLKEDIEISGGINIGVYPYDFRLTISEEFSSNSKSLVYYSKDRTAATYFGFKLCIGYKKWIGVSQYVSVNAGFNYVFFTSQTFSYSISSSDNQQTYKLFETRTNINASRKGFIAPELSFRYNQKVGRMLVPYIAINGVYSKNEPIFGREFSIFGKNETKTGTFSRRFIHAGIELGMMMFW